MAESKFKCTDKKYEDKKNEGNKRKKSEKAEVKENEKSQEKDDEELDEFAKMRKKKEECQKVWEESWERKLKEDECMEDYKACCTPDDFYRKPKFQSNIWIQVKQEKNNQHVQMAFMNVPVPKPKCPPYPAVKKPHPQEGKSICEERNRG